MPFIYPVLAPGRVSPTALTVGCVLSSVGVDDATEIRFYCRGIDDSTEREIVRTVGAPFRTTEVQWVTFAGLEDGVRYEFEAIYEVTSGPLTVVGPSVLWSSTPTDIQVDAGQANGAEDGPFMVAPLFEFQETELEGPPYYDDEPLVQTIWASLRDEFARFQHVAEYAHRSVLPELLEPGSPAVAWWEDVMQLTPVGRVSTPPALGFARYEPYFAPLRARVVQAYYEARVGGTIQDVSNAVERIVSQRTIPRRRSVTGTNDRSKISGFGMNKARMLAGKVSARGVGTTVSLIESKRGDDDLPNAVFNDTSPWTVRIGTEGAGATGRGFIETETFTTAVPLAYGNPGLVVAGMVKPTKTVDVQWTVTYQRTTSPTGSSPALTHTAQTCPAGVWTTVFFAVPTYTPSPSGQPWQVFHVDFVVNTSIGASDAVFVKDVGYYQDYAVSATDPFMPGYLPAFGRSSVLPPITDDGYSYPARAVRAILQRLYGSMTDETSTLYFFDDFPLDGVVRG